jgi:hypothetical protein
MKKSSIRKILIILFRQLWVEELTSIYNFCLQNHPKGVCSLILFPLFASGVNDTCYKFAACVADTGGYLPPVSLIPAATLTPVSLMPVANLPPVSLTPVVHLALLNISENF